MSNHYHLLIGFGHKEEVKKFITNFHNSSSRLLNEQQRVEGRKVWWNYWDRIIRDEMDFYKHLNYIHHNPVKHNLANQMLGWLYSSYDHYQNRHGNEWVDSVFEKYPIINFTPQGVTF